MAGIPKIQAMHRCCTALTPRLLAPQDVPEQAIEQVKTNLHVAIQTAPDWGKAWHSWALFNAQMLEYYARTDVDKAQRHVAPAASGFFKSVALGQAVGGAPPRLMAHLQCSLQLDHTPVWTDRGHAVS